MPEFSTISFSSSGQTLFTPEEVKKLMRVEFERAQRYGFPIACMFLHVDRLEDLNSVHGFESRQEILMRIIDLLKGATRTSDFLGCLEGDRILALYPHIDSAGANQLADRLLTGARALRFEADGRMIRITLSIGLAHNQKESSIRFETLLRVAEEGLAVADGSGGDRYVETELYQLYEKKHEQKAPLPSKAQLSDLSRTSFVSMEYRRRLEDLMAAKDGSLEVAAASLADEILTRAKRETQEELSLASNLPSDKEVAYQKEIDNLQRRIAKLTQHLGLTEEEVRRLRAMKNVEDGIASVFRDVQGISAADAEAAIKRELMQAIFEANLDLQRNGG